MRTLPHIPVETVTTLRGLIFTYLNDPISPHHDKGAGEQAEEESLCRLVDAGIGRDRFVEVDHLEVDALRAVVRAATDIETAEAVVQMIRTLMQFGAEQLGIRECVEFMPAQPKPAENFVRDC